MRSRSIGEIVLLKDFCFTKNGSKDKRLVIILFKDSEKLVFIAGTKQNYTSNPDTTYGFKKNNDRDCFIIERKPKVYTIDGFMFDHNTYFYPDIIFLVDIDKFSEDYKGRIEYKSKLKKEVFEDFLYKLYRSDDTKDHIKENYLKRSCEEIIGK